MRRSLVILLALVALVAGACSTGDAEISSDDSSTDSASDSSGDSSIDQAQVDAVVDSLSNPSGLGISEEAAACVAETALPDVSAAGADELADPMGGMSGLDDADQGVVASAMDDCIDFEEIRGPLVDSMSAELAIDELSEEETACVGQGLEDEYEGVGQMLIAFEETDQVDFTLTLAGLFGGCLNTETVVGFVSSSFAQQGMGQAEADCVANELVGEMGGSRLFEMLASAGSSGDDTLPADLQAAINGAVAACTGASGSVGSGIGQ